MSTQIDICNIALSSIRAATINSLTENSRSAYHCNLLYPLMLNQMLEDGNWQFARSIKKLATLTDVKVRNWLYAYKYPNDVTSIIRVMDSYETVDHESNANSKYYDQSVRDYQDRIRNQQVEYQIFNINDQKVIATNCVDAYIEYNKELTDTTLMPTQFKMALVHLLASELAIPLVGAELGTQLRRDEIALYEQYSASALANNANEQYMTPPQSEFITGRR